MASNGSAARQAFAPVLAALATLSSHEARSQKSQAHEYLGTFQKSPEAWTTTHSILLDTDASLEAKLFAATTLKGKITYDIDQLPRESLLALRDSLLSLLTSYRSGPRPIRTQLCVCLADLAIHMLEWKDVLQLVGSTLGSDPENGDCILEFLKVLPEEVTEGRKITLTEEELSTRTKELLEDNSSQVLRILTSYSQSSGMLKSSTLIFRKTTDETNISICCIEPSPYRVHNGLATALSSDSSFDAAVECFCVIFRETREVNEYLDVIQTLYPRIIALRPRIAHAAESEDLDTYKGVTRLFAEAGEAWVVLIARMPQQFRELVEGVLECAARDRDREAVSLTFNFWGEMRTYLTLEKYIEARMQFADIFAQLVDIMIKHLEFPTPDGEDESDLFEGDREQEEKFREFRHQMGDVLKDCCEVIGVTECLGKSFHAIQAWISKYGSQATNTKIPHWQEMEAPLFSMRAMGRMVDKEESIILPQLMPLLVQVPNHEKVHFASIMALGRYTEWTSKHPDFLEPQFDFIIASFRSNSKEVVRAAALSLRYFCQDCKMLLRDHSLQLQNFYESVLDGLPSASQEEVTEGVASVVGVQPIDKTYDMLKLYCEPLMKRLMSKANNAKDEKGKLAVADAIVREFSEGAESVDAGTSNAIYQFFEQQALSMLRVLNEVPPDDLPDVIEDFFRLLIDALLYYPYKLISSSLFSPIFSASLTALTLQQHEPLTATLHFLRDLLGYGGSNPPSSNITENPPEVQEAVRKLILSEGETLVQRVLTGMMFSFPKDCFPDASGVLLAVVELLPEQASGWVARTVQMLPAGTIKQGEIDRLMSSINQ
ncbi:MAG: Nuclear import receptor [Sclerophora amabilis]|nr:MAG: Nuclear import receptor [Sclerophora amabilis]